MSNNEGPELIQEEENPQGMAAAAENQDGGAANTNNNQLVEENFISLGGSRPVTKTRYSMYTPPEPKTQQKYSQEDKSEYEILRSWRVIIEDIEIQNMCPNIINPFVRFIIGGDFYVDIKKLAGDRKVYLPQGSKGITQVTDKINYLEPNSSQVFTARISNKIEASYFQLLEEHIHIELWDSERWFLNRFLGYESLRLIDVVQGNINQQVNIFDKIERDGEQKQFQAKLNFKLVFEEVWDFLLQFVDFRTSNLENLKATAPQTTINPKLEIKLDSKNAINKTTESQTLRNQRLPYWPQVGQGIVFRGTASELQAQYLQLTLKNRSLSLSVIGQKLIQLAGSINGQLNKEIQIWKSKEDTEQDFQSCNVKGLVRVPCWPKFTQSGDLQEIDKNLYYLVIQVTKVDVFQALAELGEPIVWVDVQWGGLVKTSRTTKRPQLNETFYFQLALSARMIKRMNRSQLTDLITEELRTRPEIKIEVWADPSTKEIISLGAGSILLRSIANAPFQDRTFTDKKTRERVDYQSRVHNEGVRLSSAFQRTGMSTVDVQVWFQQEIPYPDVDLGELKPLAENVYPREIASEVSTGDGSAASIFAAPFFKEYKRLVKQNFDVKSAPLDEMKRREQNVLEILVSDHTRKKHLMTELLSQVASKDGENLVALEKDDEFLNQIQFADFYSTSGQQLRRGIRTLKEVAHFVRCIPMTRQETQGVWATPDVLLTMRQGQLADHALLMASMFRSLSYETQSDVKEAFEREQQRRNLKRAKKVQKLLKDSGLELTKVTSRAYQSTQRGAGDTENSLRNSTHRSGGTSMSDNSDTGSDYYSSQSSNQSESEAASQGGSHESQESNREKESARQDTKSNKQRKHRGDQRQQQQSTLEDRVFVCIGKYRDSYRPAVWVMTLDPTFQQVTFWDCVREHESVLKGRIRKNEVQNLEAYLTPHSVCTSKEGKKAVEEYRKRLLKWKKDKFSDSEESDGSEEKDEGRDIDQQSDQNESNLNQESSKNSSEEEYQEDSDIIKEADIIVFHEDLDQNLKGFHVDLVGKKNALGIESQIELKRRVDIDQDGAAANNKNDSSFEEDKNVQKRQTHNFFANQQKELEENEKGRKDIHLLPIEKFYDVDNPKQRIQTPKLLYSEIDLIFNSRNIWANLQNHDPSCIYYELHNDAQWLPFVREKGLHPHKYDSDEFAQFQKWLKNKDKHPVHNKKIVFSSIINQSTALQTPDLSILRTGQSSGENHEHLSSGSNLSTTDYLLKGSYLKPFQSFYGPKTFDAPLSDVECLSIEKSLYADIEQTIRQIRSTQNEQTQFRWSPKLKNILGQYLEFIEDCQTARIPQDQVENSREKIKEEFRSQIPVGYQVEVLPFSLNFSDSEKVVAVIKRNGYDFIAAGIQRNQQNQAGGVSLQFAIGVKLFPFINHFCSLRIAIVRLEKTSTLKMSADKSKANSNTQIEQLNQQSSRRGGKGGHTNNNLNSKKGLGVRFEQHDKRQMSSSRREGVGHQSSKNNASNIFKKKRGHSSSKERGNVQAKRGHEGPKKSFNPHNEDIPNPMRKNRGKS